MRIAEVGRKPKITCSKEVFELMYPVNGDLVYEEFWVLYLNRSNQVLSKEKISQGGISGTVIDTRIIMKHGIEKLASGMILVHNHPSANDQPSDADRKITEKIKQAGMVMEINALDHVIITESSYFNFADEGIL